MFVSKMNVSILINIILEQYFDYGRCLVILEDEKYGVNYKGNHQIVRIFIEKIEDKDLYVVEEVIFKFDYGCSNFVINTSEPAELFEYIEGKIRHSLVRYNERKYLIVVNENIENFEEILNNAPSHRFISDLLFIVPMNPGIFQLWSFNVVGDEDKIHFYLVDTWFTGNHSFLQGNNLYRNGLQNQHGRILKLACFLYPPYTNCGQDSQLDGYYGTELKLVLEFCKVHNLTPKFVYNSIKEEYWGALFPNWTGRGLMGIVLRDEADIAFTAFYVWEFVYHYLDMSVPYLRTGITCLVPKPKILDGWITPLLSYKVTLWVTVVINFVFNVLFLYIVLLCSDKKSGRETQSFFNSFWVLSKIALGQTHPVGNNTFMVMERIIFGILFLAYFILNSTYFSGLASIMTVPRYEEPINTLPSLANSDVDILGIFDDWILSIKEIEEETFKRIVKHYRAAPEDDLRELSKQNNYAFFMERLPYNNYGINDFIKDDVIENYHLMKEDVYWEYTEFFLRKSSVLAPSFDMFVLRVLQSGLPSYWQRKAVYRFMDPNVQKIATMLVDSSLKQDAAIKLRFSHVEGSFALLFMGYSLSAITFFIERLLHFK